MHFPIDTSMIREQTDPLAFKTIAMAVFQKNIYSRPNRSICEDSREKKQKKDRAHHQNKL